MFDRVRITGISGEIGRIKRELEKLEKQGISEVRKTARKMMLTALANTPVWEGTAVRNYVWSLGSIGSGE